jgi:predicted dithiol-disulfide oxidoreductase (DUF899 family)
VRLSQLFGDQRYLFVIHNMGRGCEYCTIWADGFNGVLPQLQSRAAFVLVSPDSPADQARFAAARGWRFPLVSHQGTTFAADMGYAPNGKWLPGISVFRKEGELIVRVADSEFDVGDEFCVVWPLFDLIPEELGTWSPAPLPATVDLTI